MKKVLLTFVFLNCVCLPLLFGQYKFDQVLYGAAYYHEYMPYERLDKDIQLMKEAGVNVVRVGESTWALFEPQEGVFDFAWMDRIIDKMHEAGIKVILGTPTYAIPAWMAHRYPEVLSVRARDNKEYYGIRQNMDFTNPTYRYLCERIIRKMMEHYAQHPGIIGYQVDNEVEARGVNNHDYFVGFRNYVKEKFDGDLAKLNKSWGLNFWSMNINTWEEFYPRDGVSNPSYKNEWERYNRKALADFINWQCDIVNQYKRSDQFITHCFMPAFHNIDQVESFRQLQYPAINPYHSVQDGQDGQWIAYSGDFMRSVSKGNYIITETNAQTTGWDSRYQYPPYDGQLRQNTYAHLASGSNMVGYWHWHSNHYGQETYWKGILSHDLQPNRIYNEFTVTSKELNHIGKQLVNLKKDNKVAILYSHDSYHALSFMPYRGHWEQYPVTMIHNVLYKNNIETDIIPCDKVTDFSAYKLLVIPPLYVATDELLHKIDQFVKDGGQVVMLYKSAFCNEHSAVRAELAPGPLRKACGFYYQEFANIKPLPLKDNAFGLEDKNPISEWYEFLMLETAQPLAYADHPFYGKWPVITENGYGKGNMFYIGTYPSEELLGKVIDRAVEKAGLRTPEKEYEFPVIFRSGKNASGRQIHYIFNYSDENKEIKYPFESGLELISGDKIEREQTLTLTPWGVSIIESRK